MQFLERLRDYLTDDQIIGNANVTSGDHEKLLSSQGRVLPEVSESRGFDFFRECFHFVSSSGLSPGLEPIFDFKGMFRREANFSLSLKILAGKGLILPDPLALLEAWDGQTSLRLSDELMYEPGLWQFEPQEERLLACLLRLKDQARPGLRSIEFPLGVLGQVLEALSGERIRLKTIGELEIAVIIEESQLSCRFNLRELEDGELEILISGSQELGLKGLNEIVLIPGQSVWAMGREKLFKLEPFLAYALEKAQQQGIPFPKRIRVFKREATAVLDGLLPFLAKRSEVVLEGRLAKAIKTSSRPPRPVLMLGLHSLLIRIDLDLQFKYGRKRISWNHPGGLVRTGEYAWTRRQAEAENRVIDQLIAAGFRLDDSGHYLLQDEQKFFEFIYYVLPENLSNWEVFYSAEFKRIARRLSAPRIGLRFSKKYDFLELRVSPREQNLVLDPRAVIESAKAGRGFVRLASGKFLPLSEEQKAFLNDLAKRVEFEYHKTDGRPSLRIDRVFASEVSQVVAEHSLDASNDDQSIRSYSQNLTSWKNRFPVPKEINASLRDYQKEGFAWLTNIYNNGLGGILADDMGLGKTLQTITFIQQAISLGESEPFLVVCPSSLIFNWAAEIARFAPRLSCLAVSGTPLARQELYRQIFNFHIVVLSYSILQKDQDYLVGRRFAAIFLDEAQHIKNPGSIRTLSAKAIQAKARFALTGTPIENSLGELWSLFDFVLPGFLFNYSRFKEDYEKPVMDFGSTEALLALKKRISPFMLRRTKDEVLTQLPPKTEQVVVCPMYDEQKEAYLSVLAFFDSSLLPAIERDGIQKHQIELLAALTRLRQIACHPGLALQKYASAESGKFDLLFEIINQAIDGGHKTLIFSQFTGVLDLIADRLQGLGIEFSRLDGSTKVKERGEIVLNFNSNPEIKLFLISLKAGGTGLNLTSADTVIHIDPWWNPAAEDQASARAWRMGQTRPVMVYKLIAEGSVEEKILNLQRDKKRLVQAVIGDAPAGLSRFSLDQIKELFKQD